MQRTGPSVPSFGEELKRERLARDPAYHPELDRAPRRFAFRRDGTPADADAR